MPTRGLRIIAGERRGMRLMTPRGKDVTRPITDRVKENLFNILQPVVPGSTVLDLFAGSGALGLEALSRGADWATFVEQDRHVAEVLQQNVTHLGYDLSSRVITGSALRPRPVLRDAGLRDRPEPLTFNVVFLDPPYPMLADELLSERIATAMADLDTMGALAPEATIVLRRETRSTDTPRWPGLTVVRTKAYGSMTLEFMELQRE